MSGPTRALFTCDGAQVPRGLKRGTWTHERTLLSAGTGQNMVLDGINETSSVASDLTVRGHDLSRIAAYAYLADQAISRGSDGDAHLDGWQRTMALCVPVDDPDFWAQHEVVAALEQALDFATGDAWSFAFSRRRKHEPDQMPLFDEQSAVGELARPSDHVLLFSGGADSLCAAVQSLSAGRRPHLVSHQPSENHGARQQRIRRMLGYRLNAGVLTRRRFPIHRFGWEARESTQRSRAFLFASLGASVAQEIGAEQIVIADNGIVSLGLPLHEGLPGTLMSRTTHPGFLERFNELLALVLPGVHVINPLQTFTRHEALAILKSAGCPDLLQMTNSCSRARNTGGTAGHCGYCSQCVDRRFGVIRAGLESHELPNPYVLDVFTRRLDVGEKRTVPLSYVTRAKKIQTVTRDAVLREDAVFREFGELYGCLPSDPRAVSAARADLVALLQRHAREVRSVMQTMSERHWDGLYRNPGNGPDEVEQDSLLRLVFGSPATADQRMVPSAAGARGVADAATAVAPRTLAPDTRRWEFRRQGDVWLVSYEGVSKHIKNLDGMRYIAYLLSKPGEEIRAVHLYRFLGEAFASNGNGVNAREADEAGLHEIKSSNGFAQIDGTTRRQIQERLHENKHERAQAVLDHDEATITRLDEEVAAYEQYLASASGLHGKDRVTGAEEEHARDAVRNAVSRAKKQIGRHMPGLAQHLKDTLHTYLVCSYSPGSPTAWDVQH